MAETSLSKYCDEAKELIRADSYEQAIAICRHILRRYPKHVRAYRLLGEACLEKGDHVEAANLFKRVLGVDVEDMLVYVGLGIIFDEQGAVDEAIWQLERAFELSPGNAEIRGELQRLYGDRDGTAPAKLKLTPAALGRLYLREELYQRAIDEFRGVLETDAERVDIQVALAQALWWNDQKQEAAEVCDAILEKYPNCLKANLILGEILLDSGREGEGEALLETARAIDPENIVAQALFRERSPLSSESVTVPRLDEKHLQEEIQEIRAEAPSPAQRAEPGTESSIQRPQEGVEEAMPDWLRRLQEEERESAEAPVPSPPRTQEMPDWLRQLAQERAGAAEDAKPSDRGPELVDDQPPSWPRDLHEPPKETLLEQGTKEEEPEAGPPSTEEPGDWLSQFRAEGSGEEEPAPSIEPREEETPDWLRSMRAEAPQEEDTLMADEDIPAWLADLRRETAEEGLVVTGEEALSGEPGSREDERVEIPPPEAYDMGGEAIEEAETELEFPRISEEVEISQVTMERLRETMPDESDSIEDIMAWMERSKAMLAEEGAPDRTVQQGIGALRDESEDLAEALEEDQLPTWLQELKPRAETHEEVIPSDELEALSDEEAVPTPEEQIPTWLRDLRPGTAETTAPVIEEEEEAVVGEELRLREEEPTIPVEESMAEGEEAPPVSSAAGEEVPSWLVQLRDEVARAEPPLPSQEAEEGVEGVPTTPAEEVPSWLREIREEGAGEEGPIPSEERVAIREEPPLPDAVEEEAPSWLRQLPTEPAAEPSATLLEELESGAEGLSVPPSEDQEMPSWLRQLRDEATTEETQLPAEEYEALPEEPAPHVVEAELPSWLQELRAEVAREGMISVPEEAQAETLEEPVTPAGPEEIPSWLQELQMETEVAEGVTPEEPGPPVEALPLMTLDEQDIPSWLRELRAQAEEGETGILMEKAEAAAEEVPLAPLEEDELPSWLRELQAESTDIGLAAAPTAGVTSIEEMAAAEVSESSWEGAEPPTSAPEEPLVPEEESPLPEAVLRYEDETLAAPSPEATRGPAWALEDYVQHLQSNPRDQSARLALARAYSQAGDLDQAVEHYQVMLSFGSMVEKVKDDLESTADSAPDHLPTHELLADAYMRTGELQKALDKYRWLRLMLSR
ncbi:MAG TPA: tetratricopeptide repeat protein [Anaerolineae bacterium]|nr:tetratricopeptide repeat protein [Anaerolineae bacterium]